jgi:hypothetical protein
MGKEEDRATIQKTLLDRKFSKSYSLLLACTYRPSSGEMVKTHLTPMSDKPDVPKMGVIAMIS